MRALLSAQGGDFRYYNAINGGYGFLASRLARQANMGVLALNYAAAAPYPKGVRDVVKVSDTIVRLRSRARHSPGTASAFAHDCCVVEYSS
eukprot:COSAG01_NODE_1463_length_10232_cov_5.501234_4_plen_91_part_00